MKELLLTAPTGEVFVLNARGEFYIHTYNQSVISVHQAGQRIRHWIEAEGWLAAFERDFRSYTVEDITSFGGKI